VAAERRRELKGVLELLFAIQPAAHAEALAGRARVEVLAGAGHSPHMEAANEVNRLVGGFLDELEGAS
jgi:pimeloyl-ACP methyl ester carboxylesterase